MKIPTLNRRSFTSLGKALKAAPALLGKKIGSRLRELIILKVSSINNCPVCSAAHGLIGRAVGLSVDEVSRARDSEAIDSFDPPTKAALEYAVAYTLDPEISAPETIAAAATLTEHFDAGAQREIHAIINFFIFTNRFNNSWERWLPGADARRTRLGLCPIEQAD